MSEIIIYYTNDMHGRLSTHDDKEESIGLDKISKIVNLELQKNKNVFWFDAGDFSHGTPRMTHGSLKDLTNTLNSTHLNALVTGNHDYNMSLEHLLNLSKNLNAYILSANTLDRKSKFPILLPYIIYSIDLDQNDFMSEEGNSNDSRLDNIKLGVFGLSTPETAFKTNPSKVNDLEFANPIESARKMTGLLKNSCDLIIALTHLGLDESSEFTSERLAREVEGIDLIIDGHSHSELPEGLKIGSTLIVQAGSHGHYLGRLVIEMASDKKVKGISTELMTEEQVDSKIGVPDRYIEDGLNLIDDSTESIFSSHIAYSDKALSGLREDVRRGETELGNLVADAFKWKTKAEIGIVNGGTLRTGLPEGEVTFRDLISIFPFGNSVQVVEISGKTVKDMLEHSVSGYPESFGGFLDVSGLTFTFKPNNLLGNRIFDIKINGESLDYDRKYTLASLDFLFDGGDDFQMLKNLNIIDQAGFCETIVGEYLDRIKVSDVHTGRMRIIR